jgi:uncharacterized protein (TIGR02145 family)
MDKNEGIQRNATYNLEEIKVRWKKAALENCPGVPCLSFTVPGPCRSIVATPTGLSSVSVSFLPPLNDGGSPITSYDVIATSAPSAPAKRKYSTIITVTGTSSPISVTGLSSGVNYLFSVVAKNAAGGSPITTTTTTVTPCTLSTLNTSGTPSSNPSLQVNTPLRITISTTIATGIGIATGLPAGVTASWSTNVITISGTPTAAGSFNYSIPLTGGCGSVNATGTITVNPFTCGTSTILDIEGNSYNTVLIGTQCWTKENLKVTKYNDGSAIPLDASGGIDGNASDQTWGTQTTGAYTIFANDASTGTYASNYGFLYNGYAATDARKICISGWHVPTDDDWSALETHLGGSDVAGGKMKSTSTLWADPNIGADNSSKFTALPGGWRADNGLFTGETNYATFWSATSEVGLDSNAKFIDLNRGFSSTYSVYRNKANGYSVRCLRD